MSAGSITPVLCVKDVADILRVSERTALRLFQRGEIMAWQLKGGGKPKIWRCTLEDVQHYISERIAETARRRSGIQTGTVQQCTSSTSTTLQPVAMPQ